MMGKNDVYRFVARRIDGCTKADVKTVLDVYVDFIKETLANDPNEVVVLPGIGRFYVKQKPARTGVSNLNGEAWEKPATNELKFQITSTVKEL